MQFIGARSLPVIALTGLFTGMVLGLQGYDTLTRFGSEGYLGPAVAISLITELGPVLSALMVAGRFAEVRQKGLEVTATLRSCGDVALTEVASELMDRWQGGYLWGRITGDMVSDILSRIAAERAVGIASAGIALARDTAQALQNIAQTLGLSDAPRESDMTADVQEMPWLDVGSLDVNLRLNRLLRSVAKGRAKRRCEGKLRAQVGAQVVQAFTDYGSFLEAWLHTKLTALQTRFDFYADVYRAHLDRLANGKGSSLPEQEAIRKDLEALLGSQPDEAPASGH